MSILLHMTFRVREHRRIAETGRADPSRLQAILCALALLVAACSGEAALTGTTTTSEPEPTTTSTTRPPDPSVDGPVYRVGLTSEITTGNWWAALASGANPADRAIFTNTKESMFRLSRPGFVSVPALASSEAPVGVSQRGSVWVAEQQIREDVSWSDGEPVTAGDLVFYFDVVREFDLDGDHAASFPAAVTDVSAPDDHTVRVEFGSAPALTDWQIGVAMAPFVPAHFWDDHLQEARAAADAALEGLTDEEARAAVASASLTDADPGNDVAPEQVSPEQIESHRAAVAAEAGRDHLYSVEAPVEPSSGSLILESWDGADAVSRSNPDYFARGTETITYSDGSVRVAGPDYDVVYGGEAEGEVLDHVVVGPFVSGVRWRSYENAVSAHEARSDDEVDFVIDPDGLSFTQYNELAASGRSGLSISQAGGFRFLAFNLRKPPMSDPVFRGAVAGVIDKELVASSLFNGTVFPAYTLVHPDLVAFHNPDVSRPGWANGQPMGTGERYEAAIDSLAEAGYTWDVVPELVYGDDGNLIDVVAGSGLEMPNGVDVPELTIRVAPGSGEDPVRATYALWIEQWLRDLGVPAATETSDLDAVVGTAVQPSTTEDILSWDMDVLGLGGPDPALPGLTLVALFHSRNGVESGGLNTTGYSSPEFDAAADAFVASRTLEEAARWTREMELIISRDLPYVTLYRPPVIEQYGPQVTLPVKDMMDGHGAVAGWPDAVRIDR